VKAAGASPASATSYMLNYAGPPIGPQGPIAAQLPPATPGTMPAGVPGVQPAPAPLPPAPPMHGPAIHGRAGAPSHVLAAIIKHAQQGGTLTHTPPPPEYYAVTQSDGSILLHLKGPNGELGPIQKVIPPLKQKAAPVV
jgi:hypothetical protein